MKPHPQEPSLIAAHRAGDRRAADQLLRHYDPLFRRIARRATRRPADRQDVAQAARIGFVKSLATYDPALASLTTHSFHEMRHEVREALLSLSYVRLPRWLDEAVRRASKMGVECEAEAMVHAGLIRHGAEVRTTGIRSAVSLDFASAVPVQVESPEEHAIGGDVRSAALTLTQDEQTVIDMRYWTEHTLEETGAEIGRTRAGALVIQNRALSKLRKQLTRKAA